MTIQLQWWRGGQCGSEAAGAEGLELWDKENRDKIRGDSHKERRGRRETPVSWDSRGWKGSRSFVEYEGRDLALNKYWICSSYIKTTFPLWLLGNVCADGVFVEGMGRSWTTALNYSLDYELDVLWDFPPMMPLGAESTLAVGWVRRWQLLLQAVSNLGNLERVISPSTYVCAEPPLGQVFP